MAYKSLQFIIDIIYFYSISRRISNVAEYSDLDLGPVELIIDVPLYMGCFEEISSPDAKALTISDGTDKMTPSLCVSKCVSSDPTKRHACKLSFHWYYVQ